MITLWYRNGGMGHTVSAIFDYGTVEGGVSGFPVFYPGQHLHHQDPQKKFYKICHPYIDIDSENKSGNIIVSSTSESDFGKLLIILMGLQKWTNKIPDTMAPVNFNQILQGSENTFGDQIEILSLTIRDDITTYANWLTTGVKVFDIMWIWEDPGRIVEFLKSLNLTTIDDKVIKMCNDIRDANQQYFNEIKKCFDICDNICNNISHNIELNFLSEAVIHMLVLRHLKITDYNSVKLLKEKPTNTSDFIKLIQGK
jgi:hypothetical protein